MIKILPVGRYRRHRTFDNKTTIKEIRNRTVTYGTLRTEATNQYGQQIGRFDIQPFYHIDEKSFCINKQRNPFFLKRIMPQSRRLRVSNSKKSIEFETESLETGAKVKIEHRNYVNQQVNHYTVKLDGDWQECTTFPLKNYSTRTILRSIQQTCEKNNVPSDEYIKLAKISLVALKDFTKNKRRFLRKYIHKSGLRSYTFIDRLVEKIDHIVDVCHQYI